MTSSDQSTPQRCDDQAEWRANLDREDIVMFLNASFACTGQSEFYSNRSSQSVSIDFLHQYILGNYRLVYARTLAAGVNHFNQAMIVRNLLATGKDCEPQHRAEENQLITAAIANLPPQRVYRLFEGLVRDRVNNRRTRALMRRFILETRTTSFDAVKYRNKVRVSTRHAHLRHEPETKRFLANPNDTSAGPYETELFRDFAEASYSKEAIFKLPFTIAEGIAERRGVSRAELLERGQATMTQAEKLRMQASADRANGSIAVDLARSPLTKVASFVLGHSRPDRAAEHEVFDEALRGAAKRVASRTTSELGRVAVIVDRSYSSSGSTEKRQRPLAVALGAVYLLKALGECTVYWAPSLTREHLQVTPRGQTDLASPVIAALRSNPDTVVIISDGYENAPAGLVGQVVNTVRTQLADHAGTSFVHVNPVFDANNFAPRELGQALPTVGLRNAEDLLTTLEFARFADGASQLNELEAFLATKSASHREDALG